LSRFQLGQLVQLLRALRFQLRNAHLGGIQRHAQTHGPLHQQIRGVGMRTDRIADERVCRGVFRIGTGLAQSTQKMLELVTFGRVHRGKLSGIVPLIMDKHTQTEPSGPVASKAQSLPTSKEPEPR
jgi:hypothetical protein